MSAIEPTPTVSPVPVNVRLYMAKNAPNSIIAREELEKYLASNPHILATVELIDVLDDSVRALRDGVLVTPTLVVSCDGMERRVIGNLRNAQALAAALPGPRGAW